MTKENPQMKIRLPVELKEKIQELANKNNRSMNAEIITALESHINNYSLDNESENKFKSASLLSMGEHDETPKKYVGAIEILKLLDEQTNIYRQKLLNGYLGMAEDQIKNQDKK